jgi:hypothetical protein
VECLTGGGGRHLWFACAAPVRNSAGVVGNGIDVRGENGYAIAPPTRHATGRLYEWKTAPDEAPLAPLPAWLRAPEKPATRAAQRRWSGGDDPLASVAPPVYVAVLTGRQVGRDGKVACPYPGHDDSTPSCHVYETPEAGHFCFGCQRGGTIIDLAAAVWGIEPRGAGFHEIRRRLLADLGVGGQVAA